MFQLARKATLLTTNTCLTLLLQSLYTGKLVVRYTKYCSFGGKKEQPQTTQTSALAQFCFGFIQMQGEKLTQTFSHLENQSHTS